MCKYCIADPSKSEGVKTSHLSNQCRFQFQEKAPPHWKKAAQLQEQKRRRNPRKYRVWDDSKNIAGVTDDVVGRNENASNRQVLPNSTYAPVEAMQTQQTSSNCR